MEVTNAADRPSARGPAEWFTGEVWQDEIANLTDPGLTRALRVHFMPGARTAWHAHPLGQVLHIIEGAGRVQGESGPVRQVRPGDTVVVGPGERHWHGAAPDQLMSHLAIAERDPATGQTTIWYEHVTDQDYRAAPGPG
jgi:quercetin dioxygenase-like cupin family protein